MIKHNVLQPCNYQLSKSIVHEIKFGGIAVMLPYSDRYFNTNTDRHI